MPMMSVEEDFILPNNEPCYIYVNLKSTIIFRHHSKLVFITYVSSNKYRRQNARDERQRRFDITQ